MSKYTDWLETLSTEQLEQLHELRLASFTPGIKARYVPVVDEDEMLASARAAFPELRRRRARVIPPVRPGSSASVAGEEGFPDLPPVASSPPATQRAGWYSRRNG